ncbi:MAG: glycine--tRNA ligase [Lentisphaerae bacterium]|nr:glycine--tRNA ligase [Lentisphaerota bacterium]
MQAKTTPSLDAIASLCKRRGFIFQGSEIYGGINGFWDYGPLGVELKRNIKEAWWHDIVRAREDVAGLDAAIIMHPRTWEASGHSEGFTDPMVDCRACKRRYRADQLCEDLGVELETGSAAEQDISLPPDAKCPACGARELTAPRAFNLMFKTFVGPVENDSAAAQLRPETAQGIFVQFANVLATSRLKVPCGIAQIGKAFRNEINPRNYTFRSREFEQMELEFFVPPGSDAEWHAYWVAERLRWYRSIGLPDERLSRYTYGEEELAHYASACVDVMFDFPFGTQELEGIAARGDFDLRRHQEYSGKSMVYFDPETREKYIPHVIEPSAGVDRIALALICNAYREEWAPGAGTPGGIRPAEPGENPPDGYEARTVMRFHPRVAPVKVAVFPLLKNKPELVKQARAVFEMLHGRWTAFYDAVGAIGRRYRRQDEAGTPFGVTVDFQTLEDHTVTLRDRDTMQQERLSIAELPERLEARIA